jgi:GNAT superfamily N-acetyltransferase
MVREGQKLIDMKATIQTGYAPGLIGRLIELHALCYAKTVGFGSFFEAKVAKECAEFTTRLENPLNQFWSAVHDNQIVGTVAIDGEDLGVGIAHLRWFIVDDSVQGSGIGQQLLLEAMAFCDAKKFTETHLWTFKGLDAARRLYERHGFVLAEEQAGQQWGSEVIEQRFVREGKALGSLA